jgi:sec-independent protein translocase protein TatC
MALFGEDARMTFTEHLGELRHRIIRAGIALVAAFILCYIFSNQIFEVVSRPLQLMEDAGIIASEQAPGDEASEDGADEAADEEEPPSEERTAKWVTLSPIEGFLVKLKLSAYVGMFIALPMILYQGCAFVFPGLAPGERRLVQILIVGCSFFVLLGVSVAYFGVFPLVLPYLLEFTPEGVETQLQMTPTINFIIKGLLAFGIAFQFPMVVMVLVYMDILSPATLKQYRKISIVGTALVAAFLTPPDPFSMLMMMMPLILMYEGSIWMSYLVIRRKKKKAAADAGGG